MLTSAYREKEALMMDPSRLFIGLLALLSLATVVDAQNESCACSPGTYRFTLDFGSNCTEVEPTGGIVSLLCDYIALGDIENVTDFVPVREGCSTMVMSRSRSLTSFPPAGDG